MKRTSMTIALLAFAVAAAPAFAVGPAQPGTLNYVEGTAYLDGQKLTPKDVGSIDLQPGQELTTATGRAEVLLTPGVFLRVGNNSAITMVSPDIVQTQVKVDRGHAGIEVDRIMPENHLQVEDANVDTRLLKKGYYEFNANHPQISVFSGEAAVQVADGKTRDVKGHHELMLADISNGKPLAKEKPKSFNVAKVADTDNLFDWSSLRSRDLAENMQSQEAYDSYPGWYWEPGWGYDYYGSGFYNPFWAMGWGPWGWGMGWGGPFIGGYYGGGYYGGHYGGGHYYHGPHGVHGPQPGGFHGGNGGAFHAMGGGGFRGGMGGGFHGGGGGGRGR